MERERIFIDYITREVYKLLVLREEKELGEENFLDDFIDNLFIEINGASLWSKYLHSNKNFIIVTTIIAYISENEMSFKRFRREVLKTLNILNKIRKEMCGDGC